MHSAFILLVVIFLLYRTRELWLERVRCRYCGVLLGHDVHCPWNLDREER